MDFKFDILKNLLICTNCSSANLEIISKTTLNCMNCNKKFEINEKHQTIIFERVYEPLNKKNKVIKNISTNKRAKQWRGLNTLEIKNWSKKINKEDVIVDLGCGPLTNSNFLSKGNVIYIDGGEFEGIDIVCNFEKKLPIKNNCIDKILLSNVLEHIYEPSKLFLEIYRVLKYDGECLILVPFFIKHHQEPFDFNRYTRHYLNRLSIESGFNIIRIKEIGSISNILGGLLRNQINETEIKGTLKHIIINLIRKLIYFLYRFDRRISGEENASKVMPQGFLLHMKKV